MSSQSTQLKIRPLQMAALCISMFGMFWLAFTFNKLMGSGPRSSSSHFFGMYRYLKDFRSRNISNISGSYFLDHGRSMHRKGPFSVALHLNQTYPRPIQSNLSSIFQHEDTQRLPELGLNHRISQNIVWANETKGNLTNIQFVHTISIEKSSTAKYCDKNHCNRNEEIVALMASRRRFRGKRASSPVIHVFIDPVVRLHPARAGWASPKVYRYCPRCQPTDIPAIAQLNLFHYSHFPTATVSQRPSAAFAMINMEAHSYQTIPAGANNTIIISYLGASELPVSYCCGFGLARQLCNTTLFARGPGAHPRPRCHSPAPKAPHKFFHWCRDRHGGDFLACAFGLMPLLLNSAGVNRTARPLAAAWVSATCERHGGFLSELLRHMPIDMLGRCHHNRDEDRHPGLRVPGLGGVLPFGGARLTRGERKVLLGSQYRFYLGVENTILDDYVTEKFYQGFLMDSVMVYLGAPNAAAHAPAPHSFVDAGAFPSPRALAEFLLALAADEDRYAGYLAWKSGPGPVQVSEAYLRAMRESDTALDFDSVPCRLCRLATGDDGGAGGAALGGGGKLEAPPPGAGG